MAIPPIIVEGKAHSHSNATDQGAGQPDQRDGGDAVENGLPGLVQGRLLIGKRGCQEGSQAAQWLECKGRRGRCPSTCHRPEKMR